MKTHTQPLHCLVALAFAFFFTFSSCKKEDKENQALLPTITSFSPQAAAVGEEITVTGTNFSTNSADNSVRINNVNSTIVASSSTEIKVTVAPGTTTGRVTVAVKGMTATSSSDLVILGTVSTFAGNGTAGFANGTGTDARFQNPTDLVMDKDGNLYVSDGNFRVRKITPAGLVSTYAGSGGNDATDGPAATAQFSTMVGIAIDNAGNIYVADLGSSSIRKISVAGDVTTVAGSKLMAGAVNGNASVATFNLPAGIAVSPTGDLYIADAGNNCIRKISNGVVSTFAGTAGPAGFVDGNAATARFSQPWKVAFDPAGNLLVLDLNNHAVRKVSPSGDVTTLAGTGLPGFKDGALTTAQFNLPAGLAVDATGNIYIGDQLNQRIRKINLTGQVSTVAGISESGYVNGNTLAARFKGPNGLVVNSSGEILIADNQNHTIRKYKP